MSRRRVVARPAVFAPFEDKSARDERARLLVAARAGSRVHAVRDAHDTGLAERSAGISRSVAMKLTGHKTEAVYRRYAIVAESDLREAGTKLAAGLDTTRATASLGDNSGDNSVTARKERSLSG